MTISDRNPAEMSTEELRCTLTEITVDPVYMDSRAQFHERYLAVADELQQELTRREPQSGPFDGLPQEPPSGAA